MADRPEVSLEEQIYAMHDRVETERYPEILKPMHTAILASLLELQRIRAAERPEPVATVNVGNHDYGPFVFMETPHGADTPKDGWHKLYGPEVLDYADRMRAERDADIHPCCQEWHTCTQRCAPLAENWRMAAKAAESALEKLKADTTQLVRAADAQNRMWHSPLVTDALAALNAKEDKT